MTNWWKLREWIAAKLADTPRDSPYDYFEKAILKMVDRKVKEIEAEECCASLTAAGY